MGRIQLVINPVAEYKSGRELTLLGLDSNNRIAIFTLSQLVPSGTTVGYSLGCNFTACTATAMADAYTLVCLVHNIFVNKGYTVTLCKGSKS